MSISLRMIEYWFSCSISGGLVIADGSRHRRHQFSLPSSEPWQRHRKHQPPFQPIIHSNLPRPRRLCAPCRSWVQRAISLININQWFTTTSSPTKPRIREQKGEEDQNANLSTVRWTMNLRFKFVKRRFTARLTLQNAILPQHAVPKEVTAAKKKGGSPQINIDRTIPRMQILLLQSNFTTN